MSHSIATPPPGSALRRWWTRTWGDPESRSVVIGLIGVLVIHLLLWLTAPMMLHLHPVDVAARPQPSARDFNIEIQPDMFKAPPKQPDPARFVETNPEAPENTPDKTTNFGAQNQQVAQEKPTPDGKSDRPATEGKKDFESSAIVSGSLTRPVEIPPEAVAPPVEAQPAETPAAPPKAEQNPLSGAEKFEGENKDGIGGNIAKRLDNAKAIPERIEGERNVPITESPPISARPAIDPRRPMPRPQITRPQQVRPAVLSENIVGTQNVGVVAHNALKTTYGEYLQRLINVVDVQWQNLNDRLIANPVIGSQVSVKFVLNADGMVAKIVNVESTANETATRACISAITDRAPYGPWTDDMKAILGTQQELIFTFHYQ